MMTIDQLRCVNCGLCIKACSMGIFRRDELGKVWAKKRPCLECFHCAAACPQKAVGHDRLGREALYREPSDSLLLQTIQRRRSIRHFTSELPERAFLQQILDAAAYAPSGKNEHANRWTVVLGRKHLDRLFQLTLDWAKDVPPYRHLLKLAEKGANPVTCNASCLIAGWNRTDALNPQTDTVIAMTLAEQLLAEAGWGTCWAGYLRSAANQSESIRSVLGIPQNCRVYEILLVGRPDGEQYCNIPYRPSAEITWVD